MKETVERFAIVDREGKLLHHLGMGYYQIVESLQLATLFMSSAQANQRLGAFLIEQSHVDASQYKVVKVKLTYEI